MILDKGLANPREIREAWDRLSSKGGIPAWKASNRKEPGKEIVEDITKLLARYGGFTPPATPPSKSAKQHKVVPNPEPQPEQTQIAYPIIYDNDTNANRGYHRGRGRGRGGRGRGRGRGWVPPTTATR